MVRGSPPTALEERQLLAEGYRLIAGIDEVGRGSLAGPVAAAAVILPPGSDFSWSSLVRDSKLLTPKQREDVSPLICRDALAVGLAMVSSEDIDKMGILEATRRAMHQAVAQLSPRPHFLLIDGMRVPQIDMPQKGIIGGDRLCLSIACASIVAKVARDHLMVTLDEKYPGYGLARHKGYGTVDHLECLHKLGPSPIHRQSFAPVRAALI
ncbi:MAG: ribonuclease HII [Chloroflexi bacterium]|nr:ribonuclease HII [Chloroflexota bacterium]